MRRLLLLLTMWALLAQTPASADIAVIVNRDSGITHVSREDLVNVFMGRYSKLPNGDSVMPIDLEPLKSRFYRALIDQNLETIHSYWARLVFSGEAKPPEQVSTNSELLSLVGRKREALAYIDSGYVTDSVRVVLTLGE